MTHVVHTSHRPGTRRSTPGQLTHLLLRARYGRDSSGATLIERKRARGGVRCSSLPAGPGAPVVNMTIDLSPSRMGQLRWELLLPAVSLSAELRACRLGETNIRNTLRSSCLTACKPEVTQSRGHIISGNKFKPSCLTCSRKALCGRCMSNLHGARHCR